MLKVAVRVLALVLGGAADDSAPDSEATARRRLAGHGDGAVDIVARVTASDPFGLPRCSLSGQPFLGLRRLRLRRKEEMCISVLAPCSWS
jgi:hypothetical protein